MPNDQNGQHRTREELVDEFRAACEEAIEESDYATREEAAEIIEERVEEKVDEQFGGRVDEEQREADEEKTLPDKLEAHGVPQDLIESIEEHLNAGNVSKELGVDHVDPYLARQLEDHGEALAALRKKQQEQQDAVAESVAEAATEEMVLDHTIYEGQGGA